MARRWALIIGVNNYHESLGPLKFCVDDAKLMYETLVSDLCGFGPDRVLLLTDEQSRDKQPTYGNIHSWLGTWLSRPGPDDLVMVFFAGHGRDIGGSKILLCPADATLDSLPVTGIPVQYLHDLLDRCPARQKVLILDACHSGAGRDVATMSSTFRQALEAGKGLYTIASCDAKQVSYEWSERGHGVFTYYLTEAIREAAPAAVDGTVSLDAVYDVTRDRVLEWSSTRRVVQEPVRICRISGTIPIARRALTPEQRLAAADAEIRRLRELLSKLEEDNKRLSREKTEAEEALERLDSENKRLSAEVVRLKMFRGVKGHKKTVPKAKIMPWERWKGGYWPGDPVLYYFGAVILASLAGGLFGPFTWNVTQNPYAGHLVGWLSGLSILMLFVRGHILALRRLKNKYRLICAERCLRVGDYIEGVKYALYLEVVPEEVPAERVRIALEGLADAALANGDFLIARTLYEVASTKWGSQRAKETLHQIEQIERMLPNDGDLPSDGTISSAPGPT